MNQQQVLTDTARRTQQLLQNRHGIDLEILNNGVADPVPQPKNGIDHLRLRLLPDMRPRRPRRFWDPKWCFYEIGVGQYPKPGLAKVQFFMAGNNARCGNGFHNQRVNDILAAVARKRSDAHHRPIAGRGTYGWLDIYYAVPDPAKMAADLAWIVTETFHKFISLPDAPPQ